MDVGLLAQYVRSVDATLRADLGIIPAKQVAGLVLAALVKPAQPWGDGEPVIGTGAAVWARIGAR